MQRMSWSRVGRIPNVHVKVMYSNFGPQIQVAIVVQV
jgi:hypothetical protein